jgi:hypothetical protein
MGAPSFAYTVSDYHIDKDGTLSFSEDTNPGEVEKLLDVLKERGYRPDSLDCMSMLSPNKMSFKIPRDGFSAEALENLKKIIASKETVLKKALGTDSLTVSVTSDTLEFPWFTEMGIDGEYEAYSRFVCALCEMAQAQKRVTAKEKESDNDKFTMRIFLVRLGLIGPECKTTRTVLLKNLSGNSSFKNGQPPKKAAADEEDSDTEDSSENDVNTEI